MKTLLLLRHAKAEREAASDIERPLAERGYKGARKVGRFLTTARLVPDRALTSSSVRTRQTLATAAEYGGWSGPARIADALYGASPETLLREIQAEPDEADTLVVVAHEPGLSGLVALLIGGGRVEMKTAAVARIDLAVERWAEVRPGGGTLALLLPPASLRPNAYRTLQKRVRDAKEAQEKARTTAADVAAPPDAP